MAKNTNKTIETKESIAAFLATVKDEQKRKDCKTLSDLISKQTGLKAKMWGSAIIGFGTYHYVYESGREGDAPLVAFSPRASSIAIYTADAKELLPKFGKHKLSGGCIHIKTLEDIDKAILAKMVDRSIKYYKTKYPG